MSVSIGIQSITTDTGTPRGPQQQLTVDNETRAKSEDIAAASAAADSNKRIWETAQPQDTSKYIDKKV